MFEKVIRAVDMPPELKNVLRREQAVKDVFDHRVSATMFVDVTNYRVGCGHKGLNRDLVSVAEVKLNGGLQLSPSGLEFLQLHGFC